MPGPERSPSPDSNSTKDCLVATYSIGVAREQDAHSVAALIAQHFYPGTGTSVAGERTAKRARYAGRILSIEERTKDEHLTSLIEQPLQFIVQIAIPLASLESNLTMLLTAIAGEALAFGDIRLIDLVLPASFIKHFAGPKFGTLGLREILAVPQRPLLLAITKPSLGFSPSEGAQAIQQAATGGADIVKDDELLSDPSYCRRSKRVAQYTKALEEAYQQTGEKTLYAVNITDRADRLIANAMEAVELGANALMINYMQVGLDAARAVCEDTNITVPILGHNAGASMLYACRTMGMSMHLVNGLLARLCGVDLCIFLTQYGKFRSSREDCIQLADALRAPLKGLRPTLPIAAGGVSPALVGSLCSAYGFNIAIGVGGGIFGHPDGAAAGARAFRQAIDSVVQGRDLHQAAQEFEELRKSFDIWGAPSEPT